MAGIYLHIPFCKRRCIYCDFYSTTMDGRKDEYISALCHELSMRQHYLEDERIKTIYWGGGTPSQLEERHFRTVFDTLARHYELQPDAEITLEANPDDLTPAYPHATPATVQPHQHRHTDIRRRDTALAPPTAHCCPSYRRRAPLSGHRIRKHQHRPDVWPAERKPPKLGTRLVSSHQPACATPLCLPPHLRRGHGAVAAAPATPGGRGR